MNKYSLIYKHKYAFKREEGREKGKNESSALFNSYQRLQRLRIKSKNIKNIIPLIN
jgi:hypothetical protein